MQEGYSTSAILDSNALLGLTLDPTSIQTLATPMCEMCVAWVPIHEMPVTWVLDGRITMTYALFTVAIDWNLWDHLLLSNSDLETV